MSRSAWAMFVALALLWGIPYLLIRVAVTDLDPTVVVFGRTAIGGLLLLPLALLRKELRVVFTHWKRLLGYTFFEILAPWWLLSYAETRLDSSTSGLLVAGVPLVVAIILIATGKDRIGMRRGMGLAIGFAGVAVLIGTDIDLSDRWAVVAAVATVICYAIGIYMVGHVIQDMPAMGVIVASLLIAATIYLPLALWRAPSDLFTNPPWHALLSVVGLGVFATAIAFIFMFRLTAIAGPSRTSVVTYINPAIAIILGIVVLNEPFTIGLMVGFPLIILGAVLATGRSPERA